MCIAGTQQLVRGGDIGGEVNVAPVAMPCDTMTFKPVEDRIVTVATGPGRRSESAYRSAMRLLDLAGLA